MFRFLNIKDADEAKKKAEEYAEKAVNYLKQIWNQANDDSDKDILWLDEFMIRVCNMSTYGMFRKDYQKQWDEIQEKKNKRESRSFWERM
jgi:hypothetical protein